MDCYNSSVPAAVNATILYDFKVDHGDFWSRSIEDVQDQPLPRCSSSSLPLETECAVCLDKVVYAVCRKLKDGVDLTMEAGEHHIKISKSDCPKLSDDAPQWHLLVAITVLVLVLVIVGVIFFLKRFCKPREQSRDEIQTHPKPESSPLAAVKQEALLKTSP